MCQHKYFIEYVLGEKRPAGKSADRGNIVHKVLECLGNANLHESFEDDALGTLTRKDCSIQNLTTLVWEDMVKTSSHEWLKADLKECEALIHTAINLNDGQFDPRNRKIVDVEKRFDIEIKKPWASFDYKLKGNRIQGYLALKGTVDLITEIDKNTLEIVDWKTGRRHNWTKNKPKEETDLYEDFQLLLYYYAVCKLYPQYKNILLTIFYIKSKEPFTLVFEKDKLENIEEKIREKFETIRRIQKPRLNSSFVCRFCPYYTEKQPGSNLTICRFFEKRIKSVGADQTFVQFGNTESLSQYQGGGRKNVVDQK